MSLEQRAGCAKCVLVCRRIMGPQQISVFLYLINVLVACGPERRDLRCVAYCDSDSLRLSLAW